MYKKISISFVLLLANALYAFNPCNENISKQDKQSYEILNLNPPLFQCSFGQKDVWQYNQTLQKDYDATLKELQSNFPMLSQAQAKGLRYAIYMQDSLNTIRKNENNQNILGNILGSVTFTQNDINNMQEAIDFYYKQSISALNTQEKENLHLKLYGEAESIEIDKRAQDSKQISKEEIAKAKKANKEILQHIKDIMQLTFNDENEEILYVDIVNNLAFIYNANLLINEGKDYEERKYKAYDDDEALELLEQLYLFAQKIHNDEYQFIALQGIFITIQGAIMSIPIHTPFAKDDYERMINKKQYIEYYSKLIKLENAMTTTINKFKNLQVKLLQADTYSQKIAIFQEYLVKINAIDKVSELANAEFRKRIFDMLDYQDEYLK